MVILLAATVTVPARALQPDTLIAGQSRSEKRSPEFDLTARLANESNQADGILGPVTYGLIATVSDNNFELDATFIRMHEPGMQTFNSLLDEGQLMLRYTASKVTSTGVTFWKNRMMDMYTTLGGVEVQQTVSSAAINVGLYAGGASRFEVAGRFLGAGVELTKEIGNVEIAVSHLAGLMHLPNDPNKFGVGKYHHSAVEASMELGSGLPIRTTLGIERRFFDFGSGGPRSEPIDTYILVLGVEADISKVFPRQE